MIDAGDGEPFDPETSEISFVCSPAGTVHVEGPMTNADLIVAGVAVDAFIGLLMWGKTFCGVRFASTRWARTNHFPDSAICARCYDSMGEHSVRLFDPDRSEF